MKKKKNYAAKLERIYQEFCKIEITICGILFVIIIALVFAAALFRKMSIPIQWSIDVSQLAFAWLAFLGADIALRRGSLVGVALVTDKLSEKTQLILKFVCYALMLLLIFVFIRYGFVLAIKNWNRAFQTLPVSYSFVTFSLPVAAVLMVFSIIHNIVFDLKSFKNKAIKER